MRFVLIEDDLRKAGRIETFLKSCRPEAVVDVYRSYNSGLKALIDNSNADLVILDMSLPTFDQAPDQRSGRPRPLGGYDLMRKLKRRQISPPIVILTALETFGSHTEQFTFNEIARQCSEDFPDTLRGFIYYSQSKTEWQANLKTIVESV